jgi:hypothetical protein
MLALLKQRGTLLLGGKNKGPRGRGIGHDRRTDSVRVR